jgi:exodeoxyribonuclease-5
MTFGVDNLSPDQRMVYNTAMDWASCGSVSGIGNSLLTIGGYAGCGKTTLLGVFAATTPLLCAYVTYTGRASSILGRKLAAANALNTNKLCPSEEMRGRRVTDTMARYYDFDLETDSGPPFCGSMHRLLYRPVVTPRGELAGFVKRDKLDRHYDLIVVDEASMVGGEILRDLQAHGVPVLAVGDHAQLPPIMDSGELMKNPMLRLEKIHRQAEGNPIIQLSRVIRETGKLDRSLADGKALRFMPREKAVEAMRSAYSSRVAACNNLLDSAAICWTNKMRAKLNRIGRGVAGFEGRPKAGEVVICLRNAPPIYNGMRGLLGRDCTPVKGREWLLETSISFPDEGLLEEDHDLCEPQFLHERTYGSLDELEERGVKVESMADAGSLYDFGYAMTAHKSQGSTFKNVVVYFDRPERPYDDDYRRWTYTSITRASDRLTILI